MRAPFITASSALAVLTQGVLSQQVSYSDGTSQLAFLSGTNTRAPLTSHTLPPDAYITHETKITITGVTGALTTSASNRTRTATATSTSSGIPKPTPKRLCNGFAELCSRKYSNITFPAAHNSPFVRPGNTASNQALPVKTQLNDGIRFLQAQMQFPDNSTEPHFCHTSCDLLDAGPIQDWLSSVFSWVDSHPNDVVSILLENGPFADPAVYVPFIEMSGLLKYAFQPTIFPMTLGDWPTLGELIDNNKRVILFIDYKSNQNKYPWWLDEFSQVWETPFDPTNRSFPCITDRPPNLSDGAAKDRMYMINHNLNAVFDVFGIQLAVPAVSLLNETNADTGFGSVGLAVNNCIEAWGRPPNFLNVDYYNYGNYPGSLFEVAARANNVTLVNQCCGSVDSGSARLGPHVLWGLMPIILVALAFWI